MSLGGGDRVGRHDASGGCAEMNWERTSWSGVDVAAPERTRYALITPRLLAPHPNRGADSLRPDQGLALATLVRLRNLEHYAEEIADVPTLQEMSNSPDWRWRFVGAFVDRLAGDVAPLVRAVAEAPDGSSRAASAVAAACALLDFDRIEEGLTLLDSTANDSDYSVVDRAWLLAQRSRFCHEVGRNGEALKLARTARNLLEDVDGDPTADAIDAGGAALILSVGRHESAESFEDAMTAGDTVAAWWRAQTSTSASAAILDRTFNEWALDDRVTIVAEDVANDRMLAVALMASHAVDHGGWANRTVALGKDQLLRLDRGAPPKEVQTALGTLRRGGDAQGLQLAIKRLIADGPAAGVSAAAAAVDLSTSTRTTALADLTLVERAGDLLDVPTADSEVVWLLAALGDLDSVEARISPTFAVKMQLIDTLANVVAAASSSAQAAVVEHLLGNVAEEDSFTAQQWARVVRSLPAQAWSHEACGRAVEAAGRHDRILEQALLGVAARHDRNGEALVRLTQEAMDGSLAALGELGSVTELAQDVAEKVIGALAKSVRERIAEARKGTITFHVMDPARSLAVMDTWHPEAADWEPLLELLAAEQLPGSQLVPTLGVLSSLVDRIPASVRERLGPLAARLVNEPRGRKSIFEGSVDVRGPALDLAVAVGGIDGDQAAALALEWLTEDAELRRSAAHVAYRLRRCEDIGQLSALVNDPDPSVKGVAAAALTALLPPFAREDDPIAQALRSAVADPGVAVASGIAEALVGSGRTGKVADELRRQLGDHISASVRAMAAREPDKEAEPTSDLSPTNPFMRRFDDKVPATTGSDF